jgi:TRAP-type C4-dicarboxylate transport system permease small subunit
VSEREQRPPAPLPRGCGELPLRFFGGVAAALLFAMMLLTVLDVAGRYLLAAPVPGAFELTQVLLALIIFAGLPLVSARDGHVTITIADRWFGPRAGAVRDRLVALVGCTVSGVIAWRLWVLAGRLAEYGDEFEFIGVPRAVVAYPMSALAGVSALVLLAKAVRRR